MVVCAMVLLYTRYIYICTRYSSILLVGLSGIGVVYDRGRAGVLGQELAWLSL